jgi:23S rRNA pseudouridine2605 synthase
MIRLQKFLSDAGVASRRESEARIAEGRVTVNGKPAFVGQNVDPEHDRVALDGETVRPTRKRVYLVMHKPRGTMSTADDPKGRPTVYGLLPPLDVKVHSAGRLDFQTEGLLIFSNDGDFTRKLTHPSGGVERVYEVKVQGRLPDWVPARLLAGVTLDDGRARVARIDRLRMAQTNEWLEVVLTEGRYREVRRMFQAVGCNVLKLKRVRFGAVSLGKLPIGATRMLTEAEVEALREGRNPPPPRPRAPQAPDRRTARAKKPGGARGKDASAKGGPAPERGRAKPRRDGAGRAGERRSDGPETRRKPFAEGPREERPATRRTTGPDARREAPTDSRREGRPATRRTTGPDARREAPTDSRREGRPATRREGRPAPRPGTIPARRVDAGRDDRRDDAPVPERGRSARTYTESRSGRSRPPPAGRTPRSAGPRRGSGGRG